MSYIRSGSNPEGLYVYPSVAGNVSITASTDVTFVDGKKPRDGVEMMVSRKNFVSACKKYRKNNCMIGDAPIKSGDFKVAEVYVDAMTNKIITEADVDRRMTELSRNPSALNINDHRYNIKWYHKIALRQGNKTIILWRTTWAYVVANVLADIECRP